MFKFNSCNSARCGICQKAVQTPDSVENEQLSVPHVHGKHVRMHRFYANPIQRSAEGLVHTHTKSKQQQ